MKGRFCPRAELSQEHTRQGTALGVRDQILEIFPYGTAVAQIVMLMQERLEEGALWSPGLAHSRTFAKHQWRQRLESLSQG